jgi:hypothetical protein
MMSDLIDRTVIGAVEYRISGDEDNVITARYVSSGSMGQKAGAVCRGRAVGDTSGGFAGDYVIRYFGVDDTVVGDFDWHIEAVGDAYRLTWRNRPENALIPAGASDVVFEGFGFHNSDRSIVVAYWMLDKVASALFAGAGVAERPEP